MVDRVISEISRVRNNVEEQFNMWYEEAKALADVVGSSEEKPRTTRHQRHRGNMPAESTAEYYKRAFAIAFIDELLQHLRDRFSEENRAIVSIFSIIPALIISSVDPQGQTEHMKPWDADLPSPMSLPNELQRWKLYWVKKREAGATIPDNLKIPEIENTSQKSDVWGKVSIPWINGHALRHQTQESGRCQEVLGGASSQAFQG